jgi:hypothetical protein
MAFRQKSIGWVEFDRNNGVLYKGAWREVCLDVVPRRAL